MDSHSHSGEKICSFEPKNKVAEKITYGRFIGDRASLGSYINLRALHDAGNPYESEQAFVSVVLHEIGRAFTRKIYNPADYNPAILDDGMSFLPEFLDKFQRRDQHQTRGFMMEYYLNVVREMTDWWKHIKRKEINPFRLLRLDMEFNFREGERILSDQAIGPPLAEEAKILMARCFYHREHFRNYQNRIRWRDQDQKYYRTFQDWTRGGEMKKPSKTDKDNFEAAAEERPLFLTDFISKMSCAGRALIAPRKGRKPAFRAPSAAVLPKA